MAKLRYLRMSPRKVRWVVDVVRGSKVTVAEAQLKVMNKAAARPVLKLIQSAVANAEHNFQMDGQTLVVKKIFVDGGPMLKRSKPRAFGRATPIRKRTCHITVYLEGPGLPQVKGIKSAVVKSEVAKPEAVLATEAKPVAKKAVKKAAPKTAKPAAKKAEQAKS